MLSHTLCLFRNPGVPPLSGQRCLPGHFLFDESILPFFGNSSLQHTLTEWSNILTELVYKPDYPFVSPSSPLLGS